MIGPIYAIAAAVSGAAQAQLLGQAARRGPSPLGLLVRIGVVAAVLVVAARDDQLVLAASGWLTGFTATALKVYRSLR